MPDVFGVYDDMKVREYLDFFAAATACRPATPEERGPARARRSRGQARRLGPDLSRGMQQRLCLAHALVHDPQVLLLDEPASGLDPRARVELRELLRELRTLGKTIVISSHILPELEELCTSVAIVDRGRVLAPGPIADIERRLRIGAVLRVRVLAEGDGWRPGVVRGSSDVAAATILPDGTDRARLPGRRGRRPLACWQPRSRAGMPIASYSRAATDLGAVPPGHGRTSPPRWRSAGDGEASASTTKSRSPSDGRRRRRSAISRLTAARRAVRRGGHHGSADCSCGWPAASARSASRSCAAGCAASAHSSSSAATSSSSPASPGWSSRSWSAPPRPVSAATRPTRPRTSGGASSSSVLMLETLMVVGPRPDGDGRRDQPRAREADARDARRDADHVGRDRPRQAPERTHLGLAADRRLDSADGARVRVRRGRA